MKIYYFPFNSTLQLQSQATKSSPLVHCNRGTVDSVSRWTLSTSYEEDVVREDQQYECRRSKNISRNSRRWTQHRRRVRRTDNDKRSKYLRRKHNCISVHRNNRLGQREWRQDFTEHGLKRWSEGRRLEKVQIFLWNINKWNKWVHQRKLLQLQWTIQSHIE